MSARSIKKEQKKSKLSSDMDRVRRMTDEEIDYSDIPPLTREFWENAKLISPPKKVAISMRVNEDVLAWYKNQRKSGYQTLMLSVLRTYMEAAKHQKHPVQKQSATPNKKHFQGVRG